MFFTALAHRHPAAPACAAADRAAAPPGGARRCGRWRIRPAMLAALLVALLLGRQAAPALADEAAWAALRAGGAVVLLRHAQTAPGIGDPPGFRLDDCATQRNLSETGRAQARRMGAAFQARGVAVGDVLSSRWCRCLDTATEAFGRVEHWPAIDSFFNEPGSSAKTSQTAQLRQRIAGYRGNDTLVLVTHQVNITALTGVFPAMGEFVVLRPAAGEGGPGFVQVGRITVP